MRVTIRPVQAISRKGWSAVDQNPQRPYAGRPQRADDEMVPSAWRHAGLDVGTDGEAAHIGELSIRAKFLVG